MDARKKALEAYAKQVSEGNPLAEEFIAPSKRVDVNALKARNLAEDSLAQQVLKNTGVPIPGPEAPRLKREDFLNRIIKEQYPEFEPDVQLNRFIDGHGAYTPSNGGILVRDNEDLIKQVGTGFHEAGHKYDDKVMNFSGTDDVKFKDFIKNAPKNRLPTEVDPAEVYELMAKGHHANIPKLREGSFGLGTLKSYMKSGKFKAVPIVGTALAGAAALSAPDASAAVGDAVVPGGLESLGPSEEDAAIENPQQNPELRRQALQKMMGR